MSEKVIHMMGWEKKKKKWQYRTEQANTAGDLTLPSVRLPLVKVFHRNVQCVALRLQGKGNITLSSSEIIVHAPCRAPFLAV